MKLAAITAPIILLSSLAAASPVLHEPEPEPSCWDIGQPCWKVQSAADSLAGYLDAPGGADDKDGNRGNQNGKKTAGPHVGGRSDSTATGAELTARTALESLISTVALSQRDPQAFIDAHAGDALSIVTKRDASPDTDGSPGPWCMRARGGGCWKYRRDVVDAEASLLEQRACLADGGECQHARRAAEAVLKSLKGYDERDFAQDGDVQKRGNNNYWLWGGRPAPKPWCNAYGAGCWRKRQVDSMAMAARDVLDMLKVD